MIENETTRSMEIEDEDIIAEFVINMFSITILGKITIM
jgi:hypothetical protein